MILPYRQRFGLVLGRFDSLYILPQAFSYTQRCYDSECGARVGSQAGAGVCVKGSDLGSSQLRVIEYPPTGGSFCRKQSAPDG